MPKSPRAEIGEEATWIQTLTIFLLKRKTISEREAKAPRTKRRTEDSCELDSAHSDRNGDESIDTEGPGGRGAAQHVPGWLLNRCGPPTALCRLFLLLLNKGAYCVFSLCHQFGLDVSFLAHTSTLGSALEDDCPRLPRVQTGSGRQDGVLEVGMEVSSRAGRVRTVVETWWTLVDWPRRPCSFPSAAGPPGSGPAAGWVPPLRCPASGIPSRSFQLPFRVLGAQRRRVGKRSQAIPKNSSLQ